MENEDIERLREIFVTRRECDSTTEEFRRQMADDHTRLAVIESQLKTITWLLGTIGAGVLTTLIKLFLGA